MAARHSVNSAKWRRKQRRLQRDAERARQSGSSALFSFGSSRQFPPLDFSGCHDSSLWTIGEVE